MMASVSTRALKRHEARNVFAFDLNLYLGLFSLSLTLLFVCSRTRRSFSKSFLPNAFLYICREILLKLVRTV